MALTLNLPIEMENELKASAAERGVAVEILAVERLRPKMESRREEVERALRESSVRLSPLFPEADPVGSFLAEKRADAGRDGARGFGG